MQDHCGLILYLCLVHVQCSLLEAIRIHRAEVKWVKHELTWLRNYLDAKILLEDELLTASSGYSLIRQINFSLLSK